MDNKEDNKLIKARKEKLSVLRNYEDPFANNFKPTNLAQDIIDNFDKFSKEELAKKQINVAIAGRIMLRRIMGKASFIHLQDVSGQIQLFITKDAITADFYQNQFKNFDTGDIIGVNGALFKTKVGELSVRVEKIKLLAKSLRPLPEKFHGLADREICYRQRYIDLIMNKSTRDLFKRRSAIVSHIRNFFNANDFIEVETPMLQSIPGGAIAKPFKTHHNALNMDMYMRIAPELYLKRLIIGGMDKVFEINRNFRNEGLSTRHNPEFTMIEFYQAYANYYDFMELTEKLLTDIAISICGSSTIEYQENIINFSEKFQCFSVFDAILKFNSEINAQDLNENNIKKTAENLGIKVQNSWGVGKIQIEIFEATVEKKLIQPTFITEYPTEVSPLARINNKNPFITDRFELFIAGNEIANGFSELNDPEDQEQRFRVQLAEKNAGDDEAMHYDSDYIKALEYGMPPTAGEGIGIDRLIMLFTNSASIRDVIFFPHMRSN